MRFLAYALLSGAIAVPVTWLVLKTVRFIRGGPQLRRSMLQAAKIKIKWIRVARMLGLYIEDKSPRLPRTRRLLASFGSKEHRPDMLALPRPIFPRIRVRADQYGVIVRARIVPKVGLKEFQDHAQHLADTWGCTRVSVTQAEPGRLVIRAVRRDPLTVSTTMHPTGRPPVDLSHIEIGVDEYAAPVTLRLSGVPGIGIYGLPGYGKTSLINTAIVTLAPHPCVQLSVLDGKGDGRNVGADYDELTPRFWFSSGDDLEAANQHFQELQQLRISRAGSIRKVMGCKNIWTAAEDRATGRRIPGFTPDWPLTICIVDESHTYFQTVKADSRDKEAQRRNALASQNARLVEDLVKKGRAVGIIIVLATQKGTGDAIPTAIRDVCPVSMAFACRTSDAAVAALGEDIRDYPEAHPITLQDPAYIGVLTMVIEGRPGFTRVRTPLTSDATAIGICQATVELTRNPMQSMPVTVPDSPSGLDELVAATTETEG